MTDANNPAGTTESPLESVPWRKVASVAGLVLLVVVVLPFVIYAVPQVVGADHSYVVLSGSMEPTISAGDVIIVNSVAASQIEQGDVITYGGERPTTHRVVGVTQQDGGPAFRTQGDANENPDPGVVPASEVKGKVMTLGGALFVIPYVGYVIQFVNTSIGFTLLFVIPFTLLVLLELRDVIFRSETSSDSDPADGGGEATDDGHTTEKTVAAESTADGGMEESGGGLTFSARELQLGLTILVAFVAYSVWVSYATTEVWALAVAGSTAVAFLLLAGLYLFGGSAPDENDDEADDGPGTPASVNPRLNEAGTSQPSGDMASSAEGVADPGPVEFVRDPGAEVLDGSATASGGESTKGESDD
jgi:signal peptidase